MTTLAEFQRRLVAAQKAKQLPATARYDLAASTVDDDALEEAAHLFGGPDPNREGVGFSALLDELLSRHPNAVPVTDLRTLQENLVHQGYASNNVAVDGNWSPYWNSSFRRADRDAMDLVRSGAHPSAAPMEVFFRWMGNTLPSSTTQALTGVAKGVTDQAAKTVSQAPEALKEGGLLGGILTGGVTGGTIGSVIPGVGTVAGAVGGGLVVGGIGLFSSIFGSGEGENTEWWDHLSPYDEWREGGAENWFLMLDTVTMASGILKSVSLASKGIRAVRAAPKVSLGQAFSSATRSPRPGLINQTIQNALGGKVRSGAAIGATTMALDNVLAGDFEGAALDALKGGFIGGVGAKVAPAVVPKAVSDKVLHAKYLGLANAPFRRISQVSTAGQIARKTFTGASLSGISARLFGGMGPGVTPIEAAIAKEDEHTPAALHALDWTLGAVVYPDRLLPWKARDVARALKESSSGHLLLPFGRSLDPGLGPLRKRVEMARQTIGQTDRGFSEVSLGRRVQYAYLSKGIDDAANLRIRGQSFESVAAKETALVGERSEIIGQILKEAKQKDVLKSPTARNLYNHAVSDPVSMEVYIRGFEGRGSSLQNFLEHDKATTMLQTKSRVVSEKSGKTVTFIPALKDRYVTQQDMLSIVEDFERGAQGWREAVDAATGAPVGSPLEQARTAAGQGLDTVLAEMRDKGVISKSEFSMLKPAVGMDALNAKRHQQLVVSLREKAQGLPKEIPAFTAELERMGLSRYKAIATKENMLTYDHIDNLLEATGIGTYARHQRYFDSLASVTSRVDDVGALAQVRRHETVRELDFAAAELGIPKRGKQLTDELYRGWRERYDPIQAASRDESITTAFGTFVKRGKLREGKSKFELFKVDPRDLTAQDLVEILQLEDYAAIADPFDAANRLKQAVHIGQSLGADVGRATHAPIQQARRLADSMRLAGLSGFGDFMRTLRVPGRKLLPVSARQALDKTNAFYLPHALHRGNMALRYSLNPTFDASRYVEQSMLGFYQDAPVAAAVMPRRFVEAREWNSYYGSGKVSGKEAWKEAIQFADEAVFKKPVFQAFDELAIRNINRGILGFTPRQAEAAQAWWMVQNRLNRGLAVKGKHLEEIRSKVLEIGRYGTGRSPLAKSVHFVFFPFLFQEKLIRNLHNYMLAAPARNLLIHEGLRRWNSVVDHETGETIGDKFSAFTEKHIPVAQELKRLNNLAYGISPGRFVLQGLLDKKTEGRIGQAVASVFVPGGQHQPLHDLVGAFVPVAVSADQPMSDIMDTLERAIPLYRDLDTFFAGQGDRESLFKQQVTALPVVGEGAAPEFQYQQYAEAKRALEVEMLAPFEPAVQAAGYSSMEGFLRSEAGRPVKGLLDQVDLALGAQYPTGKEQYLRFSNADAARDQFLFDLSNRDSRTDAEDALLTFGDIMNQVRVVSAQANISQAEVLRRVSPLVRLLALRYGKDREFAALWNRWFARDLGPIELVRASGMETAAARV